MSSFARRLQQGVTHQSSGGGGVNYFANPSAYGYPDATNTGYAPNTTFTVINSDYTISSPGTYQNLKITGQLTIDSPNVTVTNSWIIANGGYRVVYVPYNGYTNINITYCEIDGAKVQVPGGGATPGIGGDVFNVDHCHIHDTGDGIDTTGGTFTNNYIHDMFYVTGDHTDCMQTSGGGNYTVQHNTLDARIQSGYANSAFLWGADSGDISDTLITDNLLAGGNYTSYAGADTGYTSGTMNITNNRYGGTAPAGYAQYGPTSFNPIGGTINFTGNVWDGDGSAIADQHVSG